MKCDRCGRETNITIMSMFNTQTICPDCEAVEKARPDYEQARQTDEDAIKRGNYNFEGIGFND